MVEVVGGSKSADKGYALISLNSFEITAKGSVEGLFLVYFFNTDFYFNETLTSCCPFSFQINLSSASALLKLFVYLLNLLSPSTRDLLTFALQHALFSFITASG